MKKVIFGITSLNVGGAERVLVDLVNELKSEYDITIFSIYGSGDLENRLDSNIKRIKLTNKKYEHMSLFIKKIFGLLFKVSLFRNAIYRLYIKKGHYDTEVAFLEGPITSLFSKSNKNNIAWVHTNLNKHISNKNDLKKMESEYSKYKKIIFVSKDSLNGFNSVFKNNSIKKVIYNYINTNDIVKMSNLFEPSEIDNKQINFLCVGRLVEAKGYVRLLEVSKKLIDDKIKHNIYIIGEGPELYLLKLMIERLNLKENIFLLGKKINPYPYIKKSNYFLLPSIYEGFGMVLIEAMILNKNIILTDTGAREAVENYSKKIIVDNSFDGLYDIIKNITTGHQKFEKTSSFNYNNKEIISQIKSLL